MMNLLCLMDHNLFHLSDIQDYFECIIKKHETIANNPSLEIYVIRVKKGLVLK